MFRTTRRLLFAMSLMLVGVLPGLLQPASAGAYSDTPDQAQAVNGNYYSEIGANPWGQTVTAGAFGMLHQVSLYLENSPTHPTTSPIGITIQAVTDTGVPSDKIIGSGVIPVSAIPSGTPDWATATIGGTIGLVMAPGTRYAIVLSTPTGFVRWWAAGDVYSGGSQVYRDLGVWYTWPSYDGMFQTYVIPDVVDQSQDQTSGTGAGTRQLGSAPIGQTFTAEPGILDRVSVYLGNSSISPATGPISVSIRTAVGGVPTTTEISSGTIPLGALPTVGSRAWVTASVSPVVLGGGRQYALLLSAGGGAPQWVFVSDIYSGGTRVLPSGTKWVADPSYDFAFQTLVVAPLLDQQKTVFDASELIDSAGCRLDHVCQSSFRPSVSGTLLQVDVILEQSAFPPAQAPPTASIMVTIQEESTGQIVGRGTISASVLTLTPAWVHIPISGEGNPWAEVYPGDQYSIHMTVSSGQIFWGVEKLWNWFGPPFYSAMTYKTYLLPLTAVESASPPSPGPGITPCADGICPTASASITPADLTGHITSHVQFREGSDGAIQGSLSFNDPGPQGLTLQGCTTSSAACRLTVTTFACTAPHAITIVGHYTPRKGTETYYELALSGVSTGPGTYSLSTAGYTYTLTQAGIVDVTCPSGAG